MARVGVQRLEFLMESLSTDLALGGSTLSGYKRKVLAKTANYTATAADSGAIIQVNPAATTLIQLPGAEDVGAGWWITIVITEDDGGAMDNIVNIGTKAGEFFNGIIVATDTAAGAVANGTSHDFITFTAAATSGERVDIYSDGTRMHASGIVVDYSDSPFATSAAS